MLVVLGGRSQLYHAIAVAIPRSNPSSQDVEGVSRFLEWARLESDRPGYHANRTSPPRGAKSAGKQDCDLLSRLRSSYAKASTRALLNILCHDCMAVNTPLVKPANKVRLTPICAADSFRIRGGISVGKLIDKLIKDALYGCTHLFGADHDHALRLPGLNRRLDGVIAIQENALVQAQ